MNTATPYTQPPAPIATRPVAMPGQERNHPRKRTAAQEHNHPRTLSAFRRLKLLVGGYVGISMLSLVATALMRNDTTAVNSAVWTRGTIVVVSALLTFAFTLRAARGSRRAYLRLRIISAVMVAAITVIVVLPGTFPLWMKIEQGVCGVFLIGIAAIVNSQHLRSLFAAPAE